MLHPFKGTNVCVAATLCGWDGEETQALKSCMEIANVKEAVEQDTGVSTISDSALSSVKMASVNEQEILKDAHALNPTVSDQNKIQKTFCLLLEDGLVPGYAMFAVMACNWKER